MIGDGDPDRMVAAGPDRNRPGFGDYHWFRLRSRGLVGFQEERVKQQLVGVHFLGPAAVDPAQKLLHLVLQSAQIELGTLQFWDQSLDLQGLKFDELLGLGQRRNYLKYISFYSTKGKKKCYFSYRLLIFLLITPSSSRLRSRRSIRQAEGTLF